MSAGRPIIRRPRVGILAVQGAVAEHERSLAAVGAEPRQVRRPEEMEGLDGLVIPGGESTTFGLVSQRSGLLPAVRRAVEGGLPTLGTCAGLIMLAREIAGGDQTLIGGMDVVVRRNAFGRQAASFEAELEVPAMGPEPVPGVFIRAPWIESAGPAVEILARHAGRGVAARQGHLLATAFHPELAGELRFHAWLVERARGRVGGPDQERGEARVRAQ